MIKMHTAVIAAAAVLTACSGNVKQGGGEMACSGLDWKNMGYTTATSGRDVHYFDQYRDGCAEALEPGAMQAYLDGYTNGIIEYCTYDNGRAIGLAGASMPEVCPVELKKQFADGYLIGVRNVRERAARLSYESEEQERQATRAMTLDEKSAAMGAGR